MSIRDNENERNNYFLNLLATIFIDSNGYQKIERADPAQLPTDIFTPEQWSMHIDGLIKDGIISGTKGKHTKINGLRYTEIKLLPEGENRIFNTGEEKPWFERENWRFYIPWLKKHVAPTATETDWKFLANWYFECMRSVSFDFSIPVPLAMNAMNEINRRKLNLTVQRFGDKVTKIENRQKPNNSGMEERLILTPAYFLIATQDVAPIRYANNNYETLNKIISYENNIRHFHLDEFKKKYVQISGNILFTEDSIINQVYWALSVTGLITFNFQGPTKYLYLSGDPVEKEFEDWSLEFNQKWFLANPVETHSEELVSGSGELRFQSQPPTDNISLNTNIFFREIPLSTNIIQPFCFVIMPFKDKEFSQSIFNDVIRPYVENTFEINCYRSDDDRSPKKVDNKIYTLILKSEFVITEITTGNKNVMYELGLAHMHNKQAIILSQNSHEELPFDISTIHSESYKSAEDLINRLELGIKSIGIKERPKSEEYLELIEKIKRTKFKLVKKSMFKNFILNLFFP